MSSKNFNKGIAVEEFVKEKLEEAGFKLTTTTQNEFYDLMVDENLHLEVKSAEIKQSLGLHKGKRWGRFVINPKCHKQLKDNNGWYALVLTFREKPILTQFIKAVDILPLNFPKFSFIPMTNIYRGISLNDFVFELNELVL